MIAILQVITARRAVKYAVRFNFHDQNTLNFGMTFSAFVRIFSAPFKNFLDLVRASGNRWQIDFPRSKPRNGKLIAAIPPKPMRLLTQERNTLHVTYEDRRMSQLTSDKRKFLR